MKNNKGFTLVELLVVIVILGIISALSFPVMRSLQQRNYNSKFDTYSKALVSGAKLYIDSYEEDLFGYNLAGCAYISLQQLQEKELAKDIGVDDISCDTNNTFVKVIKFQGNYTYKAYLGCGNVSKEGTVKEVSIIYPESTVPYEIDPNLCKGGDETSNISIFASPSSGELYRKSYNVRLTIQSIAGVKNDAKLYYSWTQNKDSNAVTELTELSLKFPSNQEETIRENGDLITSTSEILEMPNNADGIYYLMVKAVNLYDLSGESWSGPDGNREYAWFGPYYIDNSPPSLDGTIASNSSSYNSINPTLSLNINDNHTAKNNIKICVSVDSDSCGIDSYYQNTSKVTVPQINQYTGKTHKIYITAVDEANNKSQKVINYKVPKGYLVYYDTFGGTECEKKYVIAGENNKAKLGELCQTTNGNKKFKGWYIDNKKVDSETIIDKDTLLIAKWDEKST